MKKIKSILLICSFVVLIVHAKAQINTSSFATKVDYVIGVGNSNPQGVTAADLDNDGKKEVIVGNMTNASISVFRNITTNSTINLAAKIDYSAVNNVNYVKAIDLDGDGKKDLVTASHDGTSFSIFRNTTSVTGSISFATRMDVIGASIPANFDTADVDGDNKVDLIFVNYNSSSFSVFRNISSSGTINFASRLDFNCGINPGSISIFDMDGDGKKDLAISLYTNSQISVFKNTTTTIGLPTFTNSLTIATPSHPNYLNNADIDGDGKNDLIFGNFYGNNFTILKNTSISSGTISYQDQENFICGSNSTAYCEGVALADFDNDNKIDICVCNRGNNSISLFENISTNGTINSASMASQVIYNVNSNPAYLTASDLNNDGKYDLIICNNGTNNISIFQNQIAFSGIKNNASIEKNSISVYPIPMQNFLNINNNLDEVIQQITIYDINGSKLLETNNNSIIDVESFANGIYTIKIVTNNQTYIQKIIK